MPVEKRGSKKGGHPLTDMTKVVARGQQSKLVELNEATQIASFRSPYS